MAKMKDTIEDKKHLENVELDARYQREVANKEPKCNLENTKKSTD